MNSIVLEEKKVDRLEKVNIGVSEEQSKKIARNLYVVLADTYMLYLKTQYYHWNVTGRNFFSLHNLFEEQYRELAGAIDEIAERIRSLGYRAPGSFSEYQEMTSIEEDAEQSEALEMVRRLAVDNEAVLKTVRQAVGACNGAGDEATLGLLADRLNVHSKTVWMLRSHLE